MDIGLLQKMVNDKLITVAKHPSEDLFIYNYTSRVQYDKIWNEATMMSRGLILDINNNIVARPFKKFFNLDEINKNDLPNEPFEVLEKLDGSLGILYWINEIPHITTRGNFESKQSVIATKILHEKYSGSFKRLEKNKTYLFEIIFPENRIVVDYGDLEDILLIGIIDNETGSDYQLDKTLGFNIVKHIDGINNFDELKKMENDVDEGFVIKFKNGLRIKLKFTEYVKLHRIVTGISNVAIWRYLSEGKKLDEVLERVPDELYHWVKSTKEDLERSYSEILEQCNLDYKELNTTKETALYYQTKQYPSVLFSMLNKKNIEPIIWRIVRPKFSKAFKNIEE